MDGIGWISGTSGVAPYGANKERSWRFFIREMRIHGSKYTWNESNCQFIETIPLLNSAMLLALVN